MSDLKERWLSKKLAAFVLASLLLWLGTITEGTWQAVAMAYLGSQGLVDAARWALGKAPVKPGALDPVTEVVREATGEDDADSDQGSSDSAAAGA